MGYLDNHFPLFASEVEADLSTALDPLIKFLFPNLITLSRICFRTFEKVSGRKLSWYRSIETRSVPVGRL